MAKMEWVKHKVNRWERLIVQIVWDPKNKVITFLSFFDDDMEYFFKWSLI